MRATNPVEERVIALIEPTAAGLGYRIVRVRLSGNRRKRLQIMAERASDGLMGIDDCTKLSRALAPVFDLEDPIPGGEYDLEVSSPGIDRPLMRIEDFARFIGFDAKCETAVPIDNQRRWKGVIKAIDGDEITLATEHGEAKLKFSALSEARLVLTDKLIADDLKRAKAAEAADANPPPRAGAVASEANRRGDSPRQPAAPPDSSPQAGEQEKRRGTTHEHRHFRKPDGNSADRRRGRAREVD